MAEHPPRSVCGGLYLKPTESLIGNITAITALAVVFIFQVGEMDS